MTLIKHNPRATAFYRVGRLARNELAVRTRYRLRVLALVAVVSTSAIVNQASAELGEYELFAPERGLDATALVEARNGELLVATLISGGQSASWGYRTAYMRVDANRTIIGELSVPPDTTRIATLGDGYIALVSLKPDEYGQRHFKLIRLDRVGAIKGTLYATSAPIRELHFAPADSQRAVFVVENSPLSGFTLARVDTPGRLEWKTEFTNTNFRELAATSSGVALFHHPSSRRPPILPMKVTAVANSGSRLWEVDIPHHPHVSMIQLAFLPPDRIVIRQALLNESPRLMMLDAQDGSEQGEVSIPPVNAMRPTPHGLLLQGNLANYPYLALLDRSGDLRWWRRFRIRNDAGQLIDATMTKSGRLVVLGRYTVAGNGYRGDGGQVFMLLESGGNGKDLVDTYGRCLDVDPLEIVSLQDLLIRQHAITVSVAPDAIRFLPIGSRECTRPTDREYLAFLKQLTQSLGFSRRAVNPFNEAFYIKVGTEDAKARLTHYAFRTPIIDAPQTSFSFEVSAREGAVIKSKLTESLWPHLEKMQVHYDQFLALTGYRFIINLVDPDTASDPALLSKLEHSALRLIEEIKALPPDELQYMRGHRKLDVYPHLAPDLFGTYDGLRPISDARKALRDMISKGLEPR